MYKENPQLLKRWPTKQSNQLAAYAGLGLPGVGLGASDDRKNGLSSSAKHGAVEGLLLFEVSV